MGRERRRGKTDRWKQVGEWQERAYHVCPHSPSRSATRDETDGWRCACVQCSGAVQYGPRVGSRLAMQHGMSPSHASGPQAHVEVWNRVTMPCVDTPQPTTAARSVAVPVSGSECDDWLRCIAYAAADTVSNEQAVVNSQTQQHQCRPLSEQAWLSPCREIVQHSRTVSKTVRAQF